MNPGTERKEISTETEGGTDDYEIGRIADSNLLEQRDEHFGYDIAKVIFVEKGHAGVCATPRLDRVPIEEDVLYPTGTLPGGNQFGKGVTVM